MGDISGFGTEVLLVAKSTFPVGFNITQFADDTDPVAWEQVQLGDYAMGLNGDLITWSTAQGLKATISVIPNSDDDRNLSILAEANRVGKGKRAVLDEITLTQTLPGQLPSIFTGGKMIEAPPATSVQSAGRRQTKTYAFVFENKAGIN